MNNYTELYVKEKIFGQFLKIFVEQKFLVICIKIMGRFVHVNLCPPPLRAAIVCRFSRERLPEELLEEHLA